MPEAQAGERGLGRALAQGRIVAGPFDAGFAVSARPHFWLDESGRRIVTSDQKSFVFLITTRVATQLHPVTVSRFPELISARISQMNPAGLACDLRQVVRRLHRLDSGPRICIRLNDFSKSLNQRLRGVAEQASGTLQMGNPGFRASSACHERRAVL